MSNGNWEKGPSRRSDVASFIVMDVMEKAAALEAAGRSIIHMEVGQPGTKAPKTAINALTRALETEALGYTVALGLPALRARIAEHYRDAYGLDLDPARIVVTTGSSAAFTLAFLTLFDPGARVALPQPGYPCYRHILAALGCEPVGIETGPETRWMPEPRHLETLAQVAPLDGLLIASPANPTGTVIEPARLEALAHYTRKNGVWLISDEIYHGLTYGEPAQTALRYSDDAIIINSFSKYYSMTGWRIGWMVLPDRLMPAAERLAQNLFISAPTPAQVAALAAFDAVPELEDNRQTYAKNRAILLEALAALGLDRMAPADGAFYIYIDISHLTDDAAAFTRDMLDEIGVAATPGTDFDPTRGNRYLRLSYARSTADIAEGARRLSAWPRLTKKL